MLYKYLANAVADHAPAWGAAVMDLTGNLC
jgi:hypothetical protein